MIVEIPFVYRAQVVRHRRRTLEEVGVRARLPVRIAEAEAPLAAILDAGDGSPPVPYYAHAGGLVTPWRPKSRWGAEDERLPPVAAADLEDLMARTAFRPFAACIPQDRNGYEAEFDCVIQEGEGVRRWDRDDRGEVADAILRSAARSAIVGGLFCVPTEGPVWRVDFRDHRFGHPAEVAAEPAPGNYSDSRLREFRGDRLADALAHARALREAKGAPHGDIPVFGRIEVLDRAAFTVDDDGHALRWAVGRAIGGNRERVGGWPRAAADAWLDLRDAVAAAGDGAHGAEILDAARILAAHRRPDAPCRVYIEGGDALAEAVDRLDRGHECGSAPPAARPR